MTAKRKAGSSKRPPIATVIVVTRLAADRVVATYINFESDEAFVMGVETSGAVTGVPPERIPGGIGQTATIVKRDGDE